MSTTETTTDRLSEIKARAEKATPGPWEALTESCDCGGEYGCGHGSWIYGFRLPVPSCERPGGPEDWDFLRESIAEFSEDDCLFLFHARTDVPWLVAEVERLQETLNGVITDGELLRREVSERWTAENAELRHALEVAERHDADVRLEVEADVRAELAAKVGA